MDKTIVEKHGWAVAWRLFAANDKTQGTFADIDAKACDDLDEVERGVLNTEFPINQRQIFFNEHCPFLGRVTITNRRSGNTLAVARAIAAIAGESSMEVVCYGTPHALERLVTELAPNVRVRSDAEYAALKSRISDIERLVLEQLNDDLARQMSDPNIESDAEHSRSDA